MNDVIESFASIRMNNVDTFFKHWRFSASQTEMSSIDKEKVTCPIQCHTRNANMFNVYWKIVYEYSIRAKMWQPLAGIY